MEVAAALGRALQTLIMFALVGLAALILVGPALALISAAVALVLSLLSVAVPLALLGLLVWIPIELMSGKKGLTLRTLKRGGRQVLRTSRRALKWSFRTGTRLVMSARYLGPVRRAVGTAATGVCCVAGKAIQAAATASSCACGAAQAYAPIVADACAKGARHAARQGEVVLTAATEHSRVLARRTTPWIRFSVSLFLEVLGGAAVGAVLLGLGQWNMDRWETPVLLGGAAGAAIGLLVGLSRGKDSSSVPV